MTKRCRWLDVTPDKDGVRRVRKSYTYRCDFPAIEQPKLPISVTGSYGWKWPPPRCYVTAQQCARCPVYEKVDEWTKDD